MISQSAFEFDIEKLIQNQIDKTNINKDKLRELLLNKREILAKSLTDCGKVKSNAEIRGKLHHKQRQYKIRREDKETIGKIINNLMEQGVIKKCRSPTNSPIFLKKKPDGSWRLLLDCKALNECTNPKQGQSISSHGSIEKLTREKYHTTLNIANGFWSIPIVEKDQFKTAFTYQGQQYQWTRLPEGWCNSTVIFNEAIRRVLDDNPKITRFGGVIHFSNDNAESHIKLLKQILEKLDNHGLKIDLRKSQIGRYAVDFLGHQISETEDRLSRKFKEEVSQVKPPKTRKELQSVLGKFNFAREFVINYAGKAASLFKLTNKEPFQWDTNAQECLNQLQQDIQKAVPHSTRKPKSSLILDIYVSKDSSVTAVKQKSVTGEETLKYLSFNFSKAEKKFAKDERLLATLFCTLKQTCQMVTSKEKITVRTSYPELAGVTRESQRNHKALKCRWKKWESLLYDQRISFELRNGIEENELSRFEIEEEQENE
ncbi:uncharacterized protein LOC103177007 [Callorhinchus milii]|uniref:ribonuclease H n=1 Tax=Callorhinchus milii TaxID=7868 RepID=A0A4W3JZ36_CALMI|nr:uncharacterized protein LOC103177007 [Callorhinchus milii]|eukprot:gi/632947590/ref/XP_007889123.1/ PREDICTED: retrotransposon-like protein 1 [Callorhinchus milii]